MATAKHARWLLGAGVLSSAVYVALDVTSGLLASGYGFRDQAISELSAVGAPTQALWRIVGPIYDLLVIAFGVGVLRVAGANRRLRTTGVLLLAFGVAGALWMVFPMHERGAGLTWQDVGHIVLAASNVVFILLYIGFGAAALRGPFRTYSLVTMVVLLVAGAWSFALAPAIASGTPTPWLGAIERVNVYGYLLWVAVFAIALLKRDAAADITHAGRPACIDGFVAPGFEEVRAEFARNFAERGEIGAAVAVWWKGAKVVDLWGGSRTPNGTAPWLADTMVPVASSTKGMAFDLNDRRSLEIELPAGNGVGTARALARAYAAFVDGGVELGITPETFARVTAPPRVADATDTVIGIPSWFSLGFLRPGPEVAFGSSERAFGSPGAGGSFAFADPDARLGYAYVMNRMGFHLVDDPREKALRDAVYRAIAQRDQAASAAAPAIASRREVPAHV